MHPFLSTPDISGCMKSETKLKFDLFSLLNGISAFVGYLMLKLSS